MTSRQEAKSERHETLSVIETANGARCFSRMEMQMEQRAIGEVRQ